MANPYKPGTAQWAVQERMEGRNPTPPAVNPYAKTDPVAAKLWAINNPTAEPSAPPAEVSIPRGMPREPEPVGQAPAPTSGFASKAGVGQPSRGDSWTDKSLIDYLTPGPSAEEQGLRPDDETDAPKPSKIDPSKVVGVGGSGASGGQEGPSGAYGLPPGRYMPGSPGTLVRGGRTPHSWATTQEDGLHLTPEQLAERDAALEQQRAALEGQGDAELEGNRIKAEALRGQNAYSEVEMMAGTQRQKDRDAVISQAKAKFDRVAEAANDPDHYWESKNGLSRVLAHIGIALGAFVQGWRGTPNVALQIVNDEIDRDSKAQLRNLSKAEKDIQDLYAGFDTEDQKLAVAKAARRDWVASQLEANLENVRDAAQRAQIEAAIGKFREDSFNEKTKLVALMQGKKVSQQNDVMTADKVVGGSPGRMDYTDALTAYRQQYGDDAVQDLLKTADQTAKYSKMPNDYVLGQLLRASGVPTSGGGKAGKEEKKDAQEYARRLSESKATHYMSLADQAEELAAGTLPGEHIKGTRLRDEMWAALPGGQRYAMDDDAASNRQRLEAIRTALGHLESGAALPASEQDSYNRIIAGRGTPEDLRIGAAILRRDGQRRAQGASAGFDPGTVQGVNRTALPASAHGIRTKAPGEK